MIKSKNKIKRRLFFGLLPEILVALVFVVGVGSFLAYEYFHLPDVRVAKNKYPVVNIIKGEHEIEFQKNRPTSWVSLSEISPHLKAAVLLSEDAAFYQHEGFDLEEIQNAVEEGIKKGGLKRGASTITQQVAKNLFLSPERSFIRKFKELLISLDLERELKKNRILEIYFNIAEWGDQIYGIQKASYRYFSKHPSQIRPKEAAFLAMLLPSPKKYAVSFHKKELTPFAKRQIKNILKKMFLTHKISEAEYASELETPLSFESVPELEFNFDENEVENMDEEVDFPPDQVDKSFQEEVQ